MLEKLVTEKELCAWLKLSRATVGKLRRRDLPYYQLGSQVRYEKDDVREWLEKHQHAVEEVQASDDAAKFDTFVDGNVTEEDHEGQADSTTPLERQEKGDNYE